MDSKVVSILFSVSGVLRMCDATACAARWLARHFFAGGFNGDSSPFVAEDPFQSSLFTREPDAIMPISPTGDVRFEYVGRTADLLRVTADGAVDTEDQGTCPRPTFEL